MFDTERGSVFIEHSKHINPKAYIMRSLTRRPGGLLTSSVISVAALTLFTNLATITASFGQSCPLNTAHKFAVLGGSTVTNTNPTILVGDLGVSPGTSITGLSNVTITGTVHKTDAAALLAQSDVAVEYQALAALPVDVDLTGQDLGGMMLIPGVYHFASSAQLTGALKLDTLGNPDASFVFQIGSTLTTATNSSVTVVGGPDANVFWQIGSSATLGTATKFAGNILALASVTMSTGATIQCGSAFAQTGAVTMDNNFIVSCYRDSDCSVAGTPGVPGVSAVPGVPAVPGSPAVPTVSTSCIDVPASSVSKASAKNVYNRAKVLNERQKTFAKKAAYCGNRSFKTGVSNLLLTQVQTALRTGYTTTISSCPGAVCTSARTTQSKRTLQSIVRRMYLLQVKTKRGAMAACPPQRTTQLQPERNVKDSAYYYKQVLQAVDSLPSRTFQCR